MFSKPETKSMAETPRPTAAPAGQRGAPSIISSNLHIVGNLKTEGEIQIDGVIDGDVTAVSVTVGAHARIAGELVADDIIVHGAISGKISARQVRLAKTAKVVGDIVHEVLAIEAGAHIEGQLRRLDEEPKGRRDEEQRRKPEAVKLAVGGEKAAG
jgi:cytoskeletal protein CcmA (bactofilin family)